MILDWLGREGDIVLSWWALATLAGVAVFPLTVRLLGGLPDKGYTLARAAGLLVVGFVYWLLASLGFLRNTPGNIILAWLIVLVGGLALYFRDGDRPDLRAWWRENRTVVIVGEALFLLLLFGWALVRAHQNGLTGTEKPMELAFMSAVQRSEVFPPNDPWMSGYAISYYYFGYVMSAMLSMLSSIISTVGFNMTIALLFALTGLGSFGVAYNLVRSRAFRFTRDRIDGAVSQRAAIVVGLLGMVFVVLLGNFQVALIELPFQTRAAPESYLSFWDTPERGVYPERLQARAQGIPDTEPIELVGIDLTDPFEANRAVWWWFRASRVVQDTNLDGSPVGIQPIDEFPQFSFLLADNHPHVLALPFTMLALGLALNVLLTWRDPSRSEVMFYGLALGGLVFLNTWDGPIYTIVLVGADGLRRLMRNGSGRLSQRDWIQLVLLGATLFALTFAFYLPWLISFRSQASGLLPNLLNPTRFRQFFIMFGPFIIMLGGFLAVETWRGQRIGRMNWRLGLQTGGGILAGLAFIAWLLVIFAATLAPQLRGIVLHFVDANGGWGAVLPDLIERRVLYSATTISLLVALALVVARLFPRRITPAGLPPNPTDAERRVVHYPAASGFALLLVGAGLTLALIPEFFFLRDNFAARINTVFKFYYQAWLLFSIASAYALYSIFGDFGLPKPAFAARGVFGAAATVAIAAGLLYPVLGIHNRMFLETGIAATDNPRPLTLDGGSTLVASNDFAAISCFGELDLGADVVVAEAIGGAYDPNYGRVAGLTGAPIVLGWENHERQWRGNTYNSIAGTRNQDITALYNDARWEVAAGIIERYGIDYVFYGNSERSSYGSAGEIKFLENSEPVCENGGSVFYRVSSPLVAARP